MRFRGGLKILWIHTGENTQNIEKLIRQVGRYLRFGPRSNFSKVYQLMRVMELYVKYYRFTTPKIGKKIGSDTSVLSEWEKRACSNFRRNGHTI